MLTACRAPARPRPRLSIVVISIDTLRADHVNPRLTPVLDSLEREAVVFEQAVTVAPLTLPAHASLLTGMYPPRHGVRDNAVFALPADVATYPSQLQQLGYATGAFVSAVVLDHRYGLNRGFDVYDDEIAGPERAGGETLAHAASWMVRAPRPFFLWVHLFEPHAPYRTGSYAGEVTAVDTALGEFFRHLRDAHLWADIVLSVTADHGESLGEHGEQTHGFFLYDATLRIPWVLKAPGVLPRRVPQLVRLVDEMPTILEVAGVAGGAADHSGGAHATIDGISVTALAHGVSMELEAYSETFLPRDQFGWSSLASIRTGRFKYIDAPQAEFFDLASDPDEATNVVASRAAEANRLKRVLGVVASVRGAPSARVGPDPQRAEQLMSLGYLAGSTASSEPAHTTLADPKAKIVVYDLTMAALEMAEKGDLTHALRKVQEAERLDPDVAQIEILKGTVLGRLGRYDQAASALERAVSLNPHDTAARFRLALAWLRTRRAERAAEALREVVRRQPDDFRAWHNLAAIAYSRGDLDEADALERKALALSPEYAEAWNTVGAIALVRKQTDAALDALTRATRLAPQNAQAFRNLSLAFWAAGEGERARAAGARACGLDKSLCGNHP
jgi:tetratricopeptide (TPR) repeat protein